MSFRSYVHRLRNASLRLTAKTLVVIGVVEVTTHLPSQGRSSSTYHALCDTVVTPLLRYLDPEVAHNLAISFAQHGLAPCHHPSASEQRITVEQTVFGKKFPNPIGLAAGFDKDGTIIAPMLHVGFGFVEIGTVTPLPQPGNEQPRMFRLLEDWAIINRYGFNSQGAEIVAQNLEAYNHPSATESLPNNNAFFRALQTVWYTLYPLHPIKGLVGINIGRNKVTEDALHDYVSSIQALGQYADYMVINVSSPNTEGLRDMQQQHLLRPLLDECLKARSELPKYVPLLVKLAPDLSDEEIVAVSRMCRESGMDGIVVTNTSNQRPELLLSSKKYEAGGLSGAPIKDRSTECIRIVFAATGGRLPIIGVGGVATGRDAFEKFQAGASLVQIYSTMVYQGPGVVSKIRHELAEQILESGKRSVNDIVGMDHEELYWKRWEEQKMQQRRRESKTFVTSAF